MEAYRRDRPYITWPSEDNCLLTRLGSNINLFDVNGMLEFWVEDCLTRGLEILSAILSAQTLSAKYKALEDSYSPARKLRRAMCSHPQWEVTEKMEPSPIGSYDNIPQPNGAWFWATKFRGDYSILTKPDIFHGWDLDGCDINHFRRWGYVIWDNTRLDRLGVLKNSPSNILATIGTSWLVERTPLTLKERTMDQEEIWSRRRRSMRIASRLSERRPVFAWENLWFDEPSEHRSRGEKGGYPG